MRAALGTLLLAGALTLTLSVDALARDGDLEPSRGKFTQNFGYPFAGANGVAVDADGRAVVVGYRTVSGIAGDFVVARYRPNGYPDGSFGGGLLGLGGGKVITDLGGSDTAADVAIDSAGRIVVAGTRYAGGDPWLAVARYLPNGKLDPSFAGDGTAVISVPDLPNVVGQVVTGVAIDASDRVVVSGYGSNLRFVVARFATDGTLDTSFGGDGIISDSWGGFGGFLADDVAIDPNGRIVVAGGHTNFALARYLEDGSPDPSLGGTGKVVTPIPPGFSADADAMAIGADGRIVLAGSVAFDSPSGTPDVGPDFVLARYLDDGSLDASFNGNGVKRVVFDRPSIAHGVAIDPYGRLVAAGESGGAFAIARVLPSGALDPGFGGDGTVLTGGWTLGDHFAFAADVALAGGVRPVAVGTTQYGARDPEFGGFLRSALSVARYRGSPPP